MRRASIGFSTVRARLLAALLLAVSLGACATRPDQVDVRVGIDFPHVEGASDYAALYAPYAMMATAAYADENVLGAANHCPDIGKLGVPHAGDAADALAFNRTLRDWIRYLNRHHWECRFGVVGTLPCPRRLGPGCQPISGLGFQVWRRMQRGVCREAVIAFRGTDRHDHGDWTSNFRFLHRLIPRFDQYDQVRTHIRRVVRQIKRNGCAGKGTVFVATGHSLGGGLAQQAAYADGTIRYVYAFDSSPITGIFDVSALVRERNSKGLGVDRAYEAGEILILPRILIENIVPPWPCNPRVRTVRFNVLSGSPIAQHSISELTAKLHEVAATPGADPRRVVAERAARECNVPPFMELFAPPA